jgi:hypothetical protein
MTFPTLFLKSGGPIQFSNVRDHLSKWRRKSAARLRSASAAACHQREGEARRSARRDRGGVVLRREMRIAPNAIRATKTSNPPETVGLAIPDGVRSGGGCPDRRRRGGDPRDGWSSVGLGFSPRTGVSSELSCPFWSDTAHLTFSVQQTFG